MIVLENEKIGHETGWARLRVFDDDQLLEGLNVDITGYPYDKFDLQGNPYMYTMSGPVKVATPNRFYYHVDTSGGQSGSGVCVLDAISGNIDCLGIHTTGSNVEGNGATRITQEKFSKIGKWVTTSLDQPKS